MAVKAQITDKTLEIQNQVNKSSDLALELMARAIEKEARPNTPRDKGDLRRETIVRKPNIGTREVVWNKEYAIYQEIGNNGSPITNYTTPGTGPRFAENAARKVSADAQKYFNQAGLFTRG